MIDRLTTTLDFNARALALRSERTRVLAGNLANADTPHYQARDFDFSQALAAATGVQSGATGPAAAATATIARTRPGHLAPAAGAAAPALQYRLPLQTALDGNTVDVDMERARFADNTVRYEATLRFLNAQIRHLNSAINGTP